MMFSSLTPTTIPFLRDLYRSSPTPDSFPAPYTLYTPIRVPLILPSKTSCLSMCLSPYLSTCAHLQVTVTRRSPDLSNKPLSLTPVSLSEYSVGV